MIGCFKICKNFSFSVHYYVVTFYKNQGSSQAINYCKIVCYSWTKNKKRNKQSYVLPLTQNIVVRLLDLTLKFSTCSEADDFQTSSWSYFIYFYLSKISYAVLRFNQLVYEVKLTVIQMQDFPTFLSDFVRTKSTRTRFYYNQLSIFVHIIIIIDWLRPSSA